jgi:uncharacterized small protein (DUF1192 family)
MAHPMAMDDEDIFGASRPKPASPPHRIGQALDDLSIDELDERIAALRAEAERLERARSGKRASLDAAAAFFKSGPG